MRYGNRLLPFVFYLKPVALYIFNRMSVVIVYYGNDEPRLFMSPFPSVRSRARRRLRTVRETFRRAVPR